MEVKKEIGAVVKIDFNLLKDVEKFLEKEKGFRFINKKQFINIAVSEFLQKMEKEREK